MRVTDHRYARDFKRFELALRMIRHEARTCTIRQCTGLTDDRIRKLYRSYFASGEAGPVYRRRGKSPRQIAYFTRNTRTQCEASLLAGIFATLGLLSRSQDPLPRSLESGELLCDSFETYRQLWQGAQLSFEHAWFLLLALVQGQELKLASCPRCGGAFVHDAYSARVRSCPLCRLKGGDRRSGTLSFPAGLQS